MPTRSTRRPSGSMTWGQREAAMSSSCWWGTRRTCRTSGRSPRRKESGRLGSWTSCSSKRAPRRVTTSSRWAHGPIFESLSTFSFLMPRSSYLGSCSGVSQPHFRAWKPTRSRQRTVSRHCCCGCLIVACLFYVFVSFCFILIFSYGDRFE